MHVHAVTALPVETINTRFRQIGRTQRDRDTPLIFAADRTPPKFFLAGPPGVPPAAAEVALKDTGGGTDVVLRLMWGPLPAPFPRALAGIGLLLGASILAVADWTLTASLIAASLALLPLAALILQRQGERALQSLLANILDGATFAPRPH